MSENRKQFEKEKAYDIAIINRRGEDYGIDEAITDYDIECEYSLWLKTKNKALLEALPPLIEEAANMKDQYGCDCGHPYCRVCADTKTLAIAIDGAEKAIQGETV